MKPARFGVDILCCVVFNEGMKQPQFKNAIHNAEGELVRRTVVISDAFGCALREIDQVKATDDLGEVYWANVAVR